MEHQFFDCQWINKDGEFKWSHTLNNTSLFFFFSTYVIAETKYQEKGNLCLKIEYVMHFENFK